MILRAYMHHCQVYCLVLVTEAQLNKKFSHYGSINMNNSLATTHPLVTPLKHF